MASTEASNIAQSAPPDGTGQLELGIDPIYLLGHSYSTGVIQLDPWLEPFRDALRHRFGLVENWIKTIDENEGGLDKFSKVSILHLSSSRVF